MTTNKHRKEINIRICHLVKNTKHILQTFCIHKIYQIINYINAIALDLVCVYGFICLNINIYLNTCYHQGNKYTNIIFKAWCPKCTWNIWQLFNCVNWSLKNIFLGISKSKGSRLLVHLLCSVVPSVHTYVTAVLFSLGGSTLLHSLSL